MRLGIAILIAGAAAALLLPRRRPVDAYLSDRVFDGVRVMTPAESERHREQLRRALRAIYTDTSQPIDLRIEAARAALPRRRPLPFSGRFIDRETEVPFQTIAERQPDGSVTFHTVH